MKSKTKDLIAQYSKLFLEQDEQDMDDAGQEEQPQDVQDVAMEEPTQEEVPLTSEGENEYVKWMIDAALYKPTAEEAKTLLNLQNVMQLKRFTNAREEIVPIVMSIISSESSADDMKNQLSEI